MRLFLPIIHTLRAVADDWHIDDSGEAASRLSDEQMGSHLLHLSFSPFAFGAKSLADYCRNELRYTVAHCHFALWTLAIYFPPAVQQHISIFKYLMLDEP